MSDRSDSLLSSPTAMTALFLQQSLADSEQDYHQSISNPLFPRWDCIVLTASNTLQADGYRQQIEYRKKQNRLPAYTEFVIIPDKENQRVGSAGSTLSVIRELKQRYGSLEGKRILVLHAGGNSSRTPQYSALGKLFSPIPKTFDGRPATLFDMFMISMASMPARLNDGMMLLSGDVMLLFNPLMCDFGSARAAVISFKEPVETAKNHGVYLKGPSGHVKKFLHKQSIETLTAEGAVDERGMCSIDTGAIWLSPEILHALFRLVETDENYDLLVNDQVRLSLYGDMTYCFAEDSTLSSFYEEKPEGDFSEALLTAREQLWQVLSPYRMKLLNLSPARFIHFGSIPEIMTLMQHGVEEYRSLGWAKQINSSIDGQDVAGYNAILSQQAEIGKGCYLEVSYVHSQARVGNNTYISFLDIHDHVIPDSVLLHGLKQNNGTFVCRMIGVNDNPKNTRLFNIELAAIAEQLGNLWDNGDPQTLWYANVYPECASIQEAVAATLNVYHLLVEGTGDLAAWQQAKKKSLCSGFNDADPQAIIEWTKRMEELVHMDELSKCIIEGRPAHCVQSILTSDRLSPIQEQWLQQELKRLDTTKLDDFSYAIRLYYYLGAALHDDHYTASCFQLIASTILDAAMKQLQFNENCRIVVEESTVRLPLRVNWGGGWTDTCPHCNEQGGVVLNVAISLNGELPVEVKLVKIAENKIVFDSRDMDVHAEFDTIAPLQQTGDPFDPFALQKACLLACGIIPKQGGHLDEILNRLGGGFEMHSEVTNVPKGSGLGTSSILSAAAVKAVLEFMGIEYNEDTLYSTVLAMEQIMSTGGGWQDQVGGVTPGIKFTTSFPGIEQTIKVDHISISDRTKQELSERFAVIYTGQRRLARNLLRDVVGRYVGNEPDSLFAHKEIQKIAVLMRFALERGNVDEFATLLDTHWELSQKIDEGSTNTLIDQIFLSIEDLIDARMVCGAGGGGFLQVILKKGVTKTDVHDRLKTVFLDSPVDIWSSDIVYAFN